ncbi:MAG: aldo/keto reductase [bacterium]|nr:aldo/keto reductase [bacterium]
MPGAPQRDDDEHERIDAPRRRLLRAGLAVLGAALPSSSAGKQPAAPTGPMPSADIPRRALGKTGLQVAALALGGHHLGDAKSFEEASDIVARAIDGGINFFDNCWEYHNGKSEEWLGRALKGKRQRVILMTKVCTHGRSGALGLQMLEQSLRRLGTDYLDVWQIHAISYDNDPALAYARGGILEAFDRAKKDGKVRFVGFTGHKDPAFHDEMLRRGYPFDTVQMPLNAMDPHFFSFEDKVLPEARRRGIGVLGMKSMGGTSDVVKRKVLTAEECLRYAMSLPGVSTTISGMESTTVLELNLRVARGFRPLDATAMQAIREKVARFAGDGRFELYKVSLKYDNPETRHPHGFPIDAQEKEVKDELDGGVALPGVDAQRTKSAMEEP